MRGSAVAAAGERVVHAGRGALARAGGGIGLLARVNVIGMLAGLAGLAWAAAGEAQAAGELNLYSHRQPFLIEPFLEAFTAETGIAVNVVYASKGLAQRLQAEARNSPADVVLTVDIGRLAIYADKDLLAPVESAVLSAAVPAHLRDPKGRWFALSKRARIIAVSRDRVPAGAITRYEDLADERWAGRICSRPGSHVYNRAMMASMIAALGEEAAEDWATGLVANLARRPQGNDRAQVKAIHEGFCDIALINSYYYGKLASSEIEDQRAWAASIDLVFPNQDDRGTHINISGGGVARYSKNKEMAVAFLEFLTEETAQGLYGTVNFEFPVNPAVEPAPGVAAWGRVQGRRAAHRAHRRARAHRPTRDRPHRVVSPASRGTRAVPWSHLARRALLARPNRWSVVALLLALVMAAPILSVIAAATGDSEGLWAHLFATVLPRYVANTLALMAGVGGLSLVLGVSTAWVVTRYAFPGRRVLEWMLVLPFAVPAYLIAYVYTDFLDYAGPVQGRCATPSAGRAGATTGSPRSAPCGAPSW